MIYDYIDSLFIQRLPPDQTFSTIFENANYLLAWRYFLLDTVLVLLALLWGTGLSAALIRRERELRQSIHLSAYLLICIGAGMALIIGEIFLLVALQALTPIYVAILFTLTTITACYLIFIYRHDIARVILPVTKAAAFVTALLLLMLAFYQFSSAGTWYISDSTSYHVPYADFFLLNKGLASIPEFLIYPYQSLNFNLLYSLGLLIDRDLSYLQTMHATFATLTVFGIYAFCLSTGQRRFIAVSIAALFIAGIFEVRINRFGANVDCGSMFFVLCAVFTLYLWMKSRAQWLLIISAITFGIAMGTKYLMCIFALPIAICILITEGRNWKPMLIYIGWAAAWGLWWYIRNFIYTGNPVHPFATDIFGLYLWNQEDIAIQLQGLLEVRVPRTITGFMLMPFYAFQDHILTFLGASLVISILYASTVFAWLLNRSLNILLIFCWIYLILWFLGAQDPRYLMPIMPLVLIYCGCVLNAIFVNFMHTWAGKIISGFVVASAIACSAFFIQQEFVRIFYSGIGDAAGIKEETMRQAPLYDLISHANEIFGADATVYEFFMRDIRWFAKMNLAGNQFGPHGYYRMINKSVKDNNQPGLSPEKLERNLKETYSAQGFLIPPPPYIFYNPEEFNDYFILMYRNETGSIYKLKDHH